MKLIKVTPIQYRAFCKFGDREWHSAADIGVGLNTLDALYHKGILDRKTELGSLWFPRNNILYRLKEAKDFGKVEP